MGRLGKRASVNKENVIRKNILKILLGLVILAVVLAVSGLIINSYVINSTNDRIITVEQAAELEGVDCILVLGCGVYEDGSPTPMLIDRLELGESVYENGNVTKLLLSGDHGKVDYNEVRTMRLYILNKGEALSSDIFMDHAGFSTYESIYRARDVFGVKKMIIVSHSYHLNRALYIAEKLGVEAYGVGCEDIYGGSDYRSFREILARDKDFVKCIFKPEPTYLGEAIDIHGDGNVTDDEQVENPNGAVVGVSIHITGGEEGVDQLYETFEKGGDYWVHYHDESGVEEIDEYYIIDERTYTKIMTYDYAKVIVDSKKNESEEIEICDAMYYDSVLTYENGATGTTDASLISVVMMMKKEMK